MSMAPGVQPAAAVSAAVARIRGSIFARQVAETFGNQALMLVLGLLTSAIVARTLGPAGGGMYAVAITLTGLAVSFATLGLHASNMYWVARERHLMPVLAGNSVVISLGLGTLSALVVLALLKMIPQVAQLSPLALGAALVCVPFTLAFQLIEYIALGAGEVRRYNVLELSRRVAILALLGVALFLGLRSVEAILALVAVAMLLVACQAVFVVQGIAGQPPAFSWEVAKQTLRIGVRAHWASMLSFLVLRTDVLMLQAFRSPTEVGYYTVAMWVADYVGMLPVVIGSLLFPRLSALDGNGNRYAIARRSTLVTAAVMLPAVVLMAVVAEPAVTLLFGESFRPAATLIWLLAPGIFFLSVEVVLVQFLNSLGYPTIVILGWAAALAAKIALNIYAIPRWGGAGAAVVSSVILLCVLSFVMFAVRRNVSAA